MSEKMPPSKMPAQATNDGTPIAVRELRFCRPSGVDCPIPNSNGGRNILRTGDEFTIHYIPRMRHHRIASNDPDAKVLVFYVHESWCLWEPLE